MANGTAPIEADQPSATASGQPTWKNVALAAFGGGSGIDQADRLLAIERAMP